MSHKVPEAVGVVGPEDSRGSVVAKFDRLAFVMVHHLVEAFTHQHA